jgi:hypothetical protein
LLIRCRFAAGCIRFTTPFVADLPHPVKREGPTLVRRALVLLTTSRISNGPKLIVQLSLGWTLLSLWSLRLDLHIWGA